LSISHRPAQPRDIRPCVEILAAHPVLGPRYADILGDLPEVLPSLLGSDGFAITVFEETLGPTTRMLGGGTGCFVHDEFMRELRTPPFFWGTVELMHRVKRGESTILSDKEVRDANAREGLNLFVWHTGLSAPDLDRPEVVNTLLSAFIEVYRGYRIKELLEQAETWRQFCGMRAAGGFVVGADGQFCDFTNAKEVDVVKRPLLVGLTRELAERAAGSWVASLFQYEIPRFGLSPSQQKLLLAALAGRTDEELSEELRVSISAVKKSWREINTRIADRFPDGAPSSLHGAPCAQHRGKQKRHHLLAYLREHPEELRPYSRKLLK
jgi:hypothetical protein